MKRGGKLPRVGRRGKRRAKVGRVYGPYHRWVKGLPCIASGAHGAHPRNGHRCRFFGGPGEAHHVRAVSLGGEDYANELPVCPGLHTDLEETKNGAVHPVAGLTPARCEGLAKALAKHYPGDPPP